MRPLVKTDKAAPYRNYGRLWVKQGARGKAAGLGPVRGFSAKEGRSKQWVLRRGPTIDAHSGRGHYRRNVNVPITVREGFWPDLCPAELWFGGLASRWYGEAACLGLLFRADVQRRPDFR